MLLFTHDEMPVDTELACINCGWKGLLGFLVAPKGEIARCPRCKEPAFQLESVIQFQDSLKLSKLIWPDIELNDMQKKLIESVWKTEADKPSIVAAP